MVGTKAQICLKSAPPKVFDCSMYNNKGCIVMKRKLEDCFYVTSLVGAYCGKFPFEFRTC